MTTIITSMSMHIKFPPAPLVYQMAQHVVPQPKKGIEEAYKSILNKLRRYNGNSIVELAFQILWNPPQGPGEAIRAAPWHTLLLVKWAMQDNLVNMRVGPAISHQEFYDLRQKLWELQDVCCIDQSNSWLLIRNIIHVQLEFQRRESWGFLRWPALYAQLEPGTKNRKQFVQVMGMEPEAYIDMTYGLYATVMKGQMPLVNDPLAAFRPAYGNAVDQIYRLFVRDLPGLRAEMQSDEAQRIRGKQELFEFPFLRRFPLLRQRNGQLHCWHRLVFARGMEDAVHLRLSTLGANYVNEFSRIYEKYVTKLAADSGLPVLDEAVYKAQMGLHASAVEVIIKGDDCNILVEAKMSLFADDVLLQDNENAVFQKTKRVREAIKQGWQVGEDIRKHGRNFGTQYQAQQDFLLVVTSRELNLGNGDMMRRLYAPGEFDYPNAAAEQRLPFSHVFILSIEDFERTMGCVAAGEINLSSVLREAVAANQEGGSSRLFFSDFIGKYTKRWAFPQVMRDAQSASHERIKVALGVTRAYSS